MHKDRPHLRRIHRWIEQLRHNLLHLIIPTIESLPFAPPATPSRLAIVRQRDKVSSIRNQLAINREHRLQRSLNLSSRIIPRLQPTHRSLNHFTNPRHILNRSHPQTKAPHPRSIRSAFPFLNPCLSKPISGRAIRPCPKIPRRTTLLPCASQPFAFSPPSSCSLPLAANAQDWAKTRLEASPRHREYVAIKHGDRTVQTFVVYPEVKRRSPSSSSSTRSSASPTGPNRWPTIWPPPASSSSHPTFSPALVPTAAAPTPSPAWTPSPKPSPASIPITVTADLDAVADFAKKIPAGNGKIATVGFCWGGGKSFAFATHRSDLSAAFVFYGPGPADVTTITAPVFGFYAGNDARIGATLPATIAAMKAAGKKFDPVTYDGAGHGFMRAGVDPTNTVPGNKTAREQGFTRLVSLLKEMKTASIPTTSNKTWPRNPPCPNPPRPATAQPRWLQ